MCIRDRESYEQLHPTGPKHDYAYHTEAMDRAMDLALENWAKKNNTFKMEAKFISNVDPDVYKRQCTAQSQCDNLCISLLNAGLYQVE